MSLFYPLFICCVILQERYTQKEKLIQRQLISCMKKLKEQILQSAFFKIIIMRLNILFFKVNSYPIHNPYTLLHHSYYYVLFFPFITCLISSNSYIYSYNLLVSLFLLLIDTSNRLVCSTCVIFNFWRKLWELFACKLQ